MTDFYVHPQMGDGRLNKCKECTKRDVSENYRANLEHYTAYEKARMYLPHRIEARRAYKNSAAGKRAKSISLKNYAKNYPQKYVAHYAVSNAIRDGRLIRGSCEVCGAENAHAHHDDYTKPLEVRWLCRKHHLEHHGWKSREGTAA